MATAFEQRLQQYRQQQQQTQPPKSAFQQRFEAYKQQNPTETVYAPEEEGPSWLERNLDVPLGVVGGVAGGVAGGVLGGPAGALAGGTAGGALGTALGTYISETEYNEAGEIDAYTKAVENALWSMGFDLATVGVTSKIKPMYYAMKSKMGSSAEQTAKEIIDGAFGVGSRESLQASQAILEQGGATLLPSQVRGAALDNFRERIASVGLLSRETMQENMDAVNNVVRDELTTLINRNASGWEADPYAMGDAFYTLIKAGEDAVQQTYIKGLDEIKLDLGSGLGQRVNAYKILAPINKYLKTKKGEAVDELSPEAVQFLQGQLSRLKNLPTGTFPVDELITLDKAFTQRVNAKFGPEGAERNSVVQAELAEVGNEMRNAIYNAMKGINPDAAEAYATLKKSYGEGINALYPKINKNFIAAANKGSFLGLGNLAAKASNVNQVVALRESLHEAFKQASKDPNVSLPFSSVKEVDELFKRGFLSSRISPVFNENFLINNLKNVAQKLQIPAEAKKYEVILGKDYPRFKQVMNLVIEASDSATGDFGNLMLRSAEAGGFRAIASQVGGLVGIGGAAAAGVVSPAPVIAAGAAALFLPQMFARIVTNPAYVNRLIMMTKKDFGGAEKASVAAQLLAADVFYSLTDTEKNEMMLYLSNLAEEQMGNGEQ